MGSLETPAQTLIEFEPDRYPPFPTTLQPCAKLQTFSLSAIQAGDTSEQTRLLDVCKDQGFFYLNVSGTTSQSLPNDAEALGHLAEEVFKLPLEEKLRYPFGRKPHSLLGSVTRSNIDSKTDK